MKKLAILSSLVLLATTALAQDSTCILQPSCSQLGYTSAEADCGSAKVLRCPFDVSQVACLSGGSDSGGSGAGGDDYNPNDPNNELGDAVVFEVNIEDVTKTFNVSVSGGTVIADCGNGIKISSAGSLSCKYSEVGKYIVKLTGDFTELSSITKTFVYKIIKLDKTGITKMGYVCGSTTNGVVPPLPSTLVDATDMFRGCESIQSTYPKLPETLEIADYMFSSSTKFTGSVALPTSLKSAKSMFYDNDGLQSVTGLENTQLVDGSYMFNHTNLKTLPNLPDSLEIADSMFSSSSATITGTISSLPANLKSANSMFEYQSNLSGSVEMPKGLTNCKNIFARTSITKSGTWTCS